MDGTEIRANIGENEIGLMMPGCFLSDNPKSGQDAEGAQKIAAAKAVRPLLGKKILETRESEVAGDKMQRGADTLSNGFQNIPHFHERLNASVDRAWFWRNQVGIPQFLKFFLREKGRGEISLGIEINGHHSFAHFGKNPGQMIDERCFADAAFVVKEGENGDAHGA